MSDFLQRWDKILSWETANYPLSIVEKFRLYKLPSMDEFVAELERMAKEYQEKRYCHE